MSTSQKPIRNWQEIARELAYEQNPSKCLELSLELNQAIAQQEQKGVPLFAKDESKDRTPFASIRYENPPTRKAG